MPSSHATNHHVFGTQPIACATNRRVALSSLIVALSPLLGCATRYPKRGLSGLPAKNLAFRDPRFEPALKLKVSAWARPISAASLRTEESLINGSLGQWSSTVVDRFSSVLTASLRDSGFTVGRVPPDSPVVPREAEYAASIRSYLTAGFVYKTFASATYVPFVQVVLEANLANGAVPYHQLYVATDRPFNHLMNSTPASTQYVFAAIDSLQSERSRALDALAVLAAQLGQKFASELAA